MEISFKTADAVIDAITGFIAKETGLCASRSQTVLRQVFRFFIHSWIGRGLSVSRVRSSKAYWFDIDGFEPRGEFVDLLKWSRGILRAFIGFLLRWNIFCVGARDKEWVREFYRGKAVRVDFPGGPEFFVRRDEVLRERLRDELCWSGLSPEDAMALATVLPEDLLEGTLFRLRLFLKIVPIGVQSEICSEDLIENSSSACLVLVALQRGWRFTYKEHAVPMFIFKDHSSWEYIGVSSRVVLTEDYADHISDDELRSKCFYSKKNRRCRFKYDPKGRVLLCLPFISRIAWLAGDGWAQDMGFYENDLKGICELIERWPDSEKPLVRHHPKRSKGIPDESFPPETYDGSAVREVIFVGWTQGLFECLDAGVPARVLLPRPMRSLSETGQSYFRWLKGKGVLSSDQLF